MHYFCSLIASIHPGTREVIMFTNILQYQPQFTHPSIHSSPSFQQLYYLILTSECLHVLDSHAQDGQLVQLPGHGVTGGHQWRQLVNEAVHLVPATLLNLAVSLSAEIQGETLDINRLIV